MRSRAGLFTSRNPSEHDRCKNEQDEVRHPHTQHHRDLAPGGEELAVVEHHVVRHDNGHRCRQAEPSAPAPVPDPERKADEGEDDGCSGDCDALVQLDAGLTDVLGCGLRAACAQPGDQVRRERLPDAEVNALIRVHGGLPESDSEFRVVVLPIRVGLVGAELMGRGVLQVEPRAAVPRIDEQVARVGGHEAFLEGVRQIEQDDPVPATAPAIDLVHVEELIRKVLGKDALLDGGRGGREGDLTRDLGEVRIRSRHHGEDQNEVDAEDDDGKTHQRSRHPAQGYAARLHRNQLGVGRPAGGGHQHREQCPDRKGQRQDVGHPEQEQFQSDRKGDVPRDEEIGQDKHGADEKEKRGDARREQESREHFANQGAGDDKSVGDSHQAGCYGRAGGLPTRAGRTRKEGRKEGRRKGVGPSARNFRRGDDFHTGRSVAMSDKIYYVKMLIHRNHQSLSPRNRSLPKQRWASSIASVAPR